MAVPQLSIQVVVCSGLDYVRTCVESIFKHTTDVPFTLRLWDNASDKKTARYLQSLLKTHANVTLSQSPRNFGFGEPHNSLAHMGDEPFLCFLNSDAVVAPGWASKALELFSLDSEIGAVGPIHKCEQRIHYLEGSCLFMRRSVAQAFGPFDTAMFPFAYSEDSDLSGRLQKAGWKLCRLPVTIRHDKPNSTADLVQKRGGVDVHGIAAHNRQMFRRRYRHADAWRYEGRHVWRRRASLGDILCLLPVLAGWRRDHGPEPVLHLQTFMLQAVSGCPHFNDVYEADEKYNDHVMIDFDRCNEGVTRENGYQIEHMVDAYARMAGVTLTGEEKRPLVYLKPWELDWPKRHLPNRYLVLVSEAHWTIREYLRWHQVIPLLWERFRLPIVIIGTESHPRYKPAPYLIDLRRQTTQRQAMAIVAEAAGVVTPDTGMLHVAGAFSIPTGAVFGPVLAWTRIHAGQVAVETNLACRGCFSRRMWDDYEETPCMRCVRIGYHIDALRWKTKIPCMEEIAPERIVDALEQSMAIYDRKVAG